MMFGGEDTGVEEDEADNQPEHPLGLANLNTRLVREAPKKNFF